jgi:DNA polymerase-4
VGVRVEGIVEADEVEPQLVLGAPERGWREAEEAVDRLTDRFGRGSVRPARLLPETPTALPPDTPTQPRRAPR